MDALKLVSAAPFIHPAAARKAFFRGAISLSEPGFRNLLFAVVDLSRERFARVRSSW
jgi:hypothetical protein